MLQHRPDGLRIHRGIVRGLVEETRTRGFPSPTFGGFGFVVDCCAAVIYLPGENVLMLKLIAFFRMTGHARFVLNGLLRLSKHLNSVSDIAGDDQSCLLKYLLLLHLDLSTLTPDRQSPQKNPGLSARAYL